MHKVSPLNGWWVSQKGEIGLFFATDPKSLQWLSRVITQFLYAMDSVPIRTKNSFTMDLEAAIETCTEFIGNALQLVEHNHEVAV